MPNAMRRIGSGIFFFGFFLWELLLANFRVAFEVVTIKSSMHPSILAVPLEARTNLEITMLASLISLTPGTLSLDVSTDRKVLYIHAMYQGEIERSKNLEEKLLRVLR